MRISRIYHPDEISIDDEIELYPQAATHLTRVLRCKESDKLVLFNGNGNEYPAVITRIYRNHAWARIISVDSTNRESPLNITLAQAISKGERMDYTIQKAVELGISKIIPINTERSTSLKADRIKKKVQHWQGIAASACEQCGRNIVPDISIPVNLDDWLATCKSSSLNLILEPMAENSIGNIDFSNENITLTIGPEGGLSDIEISRCLQQDLTGIRMGPRILRTETAAITALSILQSRWGDLD